MTEVSTIAHFLSEYVSRIDFLGHMLDLESFVLDPLADRVLMEFNVSCRFGGHVIGPTDACLIVIVEDCGSIKRGKSVSCIGYTAVEISKVKDLLRNSIGCTNLGLARTQGGTVLTVTKPTNRAPVLENDSTIHAAELEQG
jgi:hypothetical protein